jgi:threonine dehydrogenase-like Zn-dependent dehydrogenase
VEGPRRGHAQPPVRRIRRYQLVGPGRGRVVEVDAPELGPGEALVRVDAAGVCASDLPVWSRRQARYPVALGHEPVGEVVATGSGVDLAVGTTVTGRVMKSFADHAVADAGDLVTVPSGVPVDVALGEPLGCVAEAWRRTTVALGDRVAIVGLGFMGMCMLQMLARSAQASLVAFELRSDARADAADLGADAALHPDAVDDDPTLRDAFDVVVEATGVQAGLDLATRLVRPHGTLSVLGYHQGPRTVDMASWNVKALDVVNAHVRDRGLLRDATRRALAMVAAGRLDVPRLITHRFPLTAVDEAFAVLRDRPDGFIKAIVVPTSPA